jgi:C1A family cysteine protease
MTTVFDERLLGALPSPPDPRDLDITPLLDTAPRLPRRHVAALMPRVLDQGDTGRCVAFASTGIKQWEERRDGHTFLGFDPDWLYLQAGGTQDRQGGLFCRAALRVLKHEGARLERHPGSEAGFRIAAYYAVPFALDTLKRALLAYGPLLIASVWYGSWFHPRDGILPAPDGHVVGGHARVFFGWDDSVNGGAFLVRNSWGRDWPGSVNGNTYDAYRHLLPALHDAWKARDVKETA